MNKIKKKYYLPKEVSAVIRKHMSREELENELGQGCNRLFYFSGVVKNHERETLSKVIDESYKRAKIDGEVLTQVKKDLGLEIK